jgi:hypothetical protein
MAFLVLVIDCPNDNIDNLNSIIQRPTKTYESVNNARNYLEAIAGGLKDAAVQITTRDTDPAVSTSGTDSTQYSYNLK